MQDLMMGVAMVTMMVLILAACAASTLRIETNPTNKGWRRG